MNYSSNQDAVATGNTLKRTVAHLSVDELLNTIANIEEKVAMGSAQIYDYELYVMCQQALFKHSATRVYYKPS